MLNDNNTCPICLFRTTTHITQCNHSYCINCLCRIKKCAICRTQLQQFIINNEIRSKNRTISNKHQSSGYADMSRIYPIYNFNISPEMYQPSGYMDMSRILSLTIRFSNYDA
jgi:hypothetical protein